LFWQKYGPYIKVLFLLINTGAVISSMFAKVVLNGQLQPSDIGGDLPFFLLQNA